MATKRICPIEGCGKNIHAYGFCYSHAYRFKRHGDPLAGRRGSPRGAPLRWIETNVNYVGDDCLKWPFETTHYGYGTVKHEGKRRPSSRVMCIFAHGEPPTPTHEAAHSCGNGHLGCMNPKHLRWATKLENVHEAMAHGTNVRGEKCHWAKFTENDVRKIRRLANSIVAKDIAKIYGVRTSSIIRIVQRKRWTWVE